MKAPLSTDEKHDNHRGLTQRAILLMTANTIAMVISFALPLILTRIMSQEEFGLYKLSFQIMLTALGLLNLQVAVSAFYFMEREPEKKLQVTLNVVIFYGVAGAAVALLFLLWPGVAGLISQSADLLIPHMPLLGLVILVWLIATNLESAQIAAGDVRIASSLIVIAQFVRSLLMVIAALAFGTLNSILIAAILQGVIHLVLIAIYLRRRFGSLWAPFDWRLFKVQVGSALPFGMGGIAAVLQEDMHNYFVSLHYDAASFAVYSIGCFQLPLLYVLTNSFSSAFNPEVARHQKAGNYEGIYLAWAQVTRSLAFILAPTFALLLLMRREFITGLFTAQYAASVPIFGIYLLMVLIQISMHYPILRAFDEFKFFRFKLYAVLLPVTFAALHLGHRLAGLVGIAAAVVFVRVLDVVIIVRALSRKMGMSWRHLRHFAPLTRIAAAVATAGVAAGLARIALIKSEWVSRLAGDIAHAVKLRGSATEWNSLLLLAGCSLVFGIVYLTSAWVMGAVSETEKAALRKLLVKFRLRREPAQPVELIS
jgi:O-antigen/teichoic acid export membrane protein